MNSLLLALVVPAVLLPACVPLRVEFVQPAFKTGGLKGKTVAVGEVVSAHGENDPTPWDSATILRNCEDRLRQKRPRTTVISSSALERHVGELRNRLSTSVDLPRCVVSSKQAARASARNIDYILVIEVLHNQVTNNVSHHEEAETEEERDKEGNVVCERTSTTYVTTSHATRRVGSRFYLLDTHTREIAWQAVSNHLQCNENSVESGFWYSDVIPAMPSPPPMSDVVMASTNAAVRKLPK
jgi:hypothetical protein